MHHWPIDYIQSLNNQYEVSFVEAANHQHDNHLKQYEVILIDLSLHHDLVKDDNPSINIPN